MRSYWFGDFDGLKYIPPPDDPDARARRIAGLFEKKDTPLPDWALAVRYGIVHDRQEYLERVRETAAKIAAGRLQEARRMNASGLVQMVRMLDQLDETVNLLTERAEDWFLATGGNLPRLASHSGRRDLIDLMHQNAGEGLTLVLTEIDRVTGARRILSRFIEDIAWDVLPNCSALVGGLVAARLAAEAGGVSELARLPGSSIQVLGAKKALFAHLAGGSPPPKHGIVYQHGKVHGSRKEVRGKISRVISAKLAIAARIDYFRKESDPVFIRESRTAIRKSGV